MPGQHRARDYDLILGNLICDRLGLDPATVSRDVSIENMSAATVMVKTTNVHFIPQADMEDLRASAHARWLAGA